MKHNLVWLAFVVILFSCLPGNAFGGQVNTFIYHRFDETRYPSTDISSAIFRRQLEYVQAHNIQVLSLDEIARRLAAGQPLPDQAVAFCVDDAFESFYKVAMPIIREFGYPVTLFVNSDSVGGKGYMGWDQLQDVLSQGVTIGNHTASHAYLVEKQPGESQEQWQQRVRADILAAQTALQKHLGRDATLFAYPYGEYSASLVDVVKDLGFSAAFAQQSGVIYSGSDRFTLPRFPMGGPFATIDGFISKLNMKPLLIAEQEPFDPVVRNNPPELKLQLPAASAFRLGSANCFVQGENSCHIEKLSGLGERWYRVVAEKPLSGRRNKYTVTYLDAHGHWHWFSHPWILADHPAD